MIAAPIIIRPKRLSSNFSRRLRGFCLDAFLVGLALPLGLEVCLVPPFLSARLAPVAFLLMSGGAYPAGRDLSTRTRTRQGFLTGF